MKEEVRNRVIASPYSPGKAHLTDCSLPIEMLHPDSTNNLYTVNPIRSSFKTILPLNLMTRVPA